VPATVLNRATPEIARRELLKLAQDCNRPSGQGNAMFAACLHVVGWHRPDFLAEVYFRRHMKLKIFVFSKFYGLNPRKNPDPSRPLGAGQPAAPFAGTIGNPERRTEMKIPGFTTRKSDRIFTDQPRISTDQPGGWFFFISGGPFESASQGTIAMPGSVSSF
jgi:hypothetical protein